MKKYWCANNKQVIQILTIHHLKQVWYILLLFRDTERERERSKVASHETTTTGLDDDDALLIADSFTSPSFSAGAGGAGATQHYTSI